jgi:hypothetical protein
LFESLWVSTQAPLQTVSPPGHWHEPPFATVAQTSPDAEHAPQAPPPLPHDDGDWLPAPSQVLPLQPPLQPVMALQMHMPPEQVVPGAQTLPQPPQLLLSLEKSAHPELHGVKPPLQV